MIQAPETPPVKPKQIDDDISMRNRPLLQSQPSENTASCSTVVSRESSQPYSVDVTSDSKEPLTNHRASSRLRKRRRTHSVATTVSNETLFDIVNKATSPRQQTSRAQHTTKSIVSEILNETFNRALSASNATSPCQDFVPDRTTSLPRFTADLARKGYLYGIHYCRPYSRRSRCRLSARLRCLSFKEPQNCKASFIAKLRLNKNVWELKGIPKHNHVRSKPQPNSWRERYDAVANSVKRQLQKHEVLPYQTPTVKPPSPPSRIPAAPIHQKPFMTTSHTTHPSMAPRLEPRVASTAPQLNYIRTVSQGPIILQPNSTPAFVWLIPPMLRTPCAPGSLPLIAPRLPHVFVSPRNHVLFSLPLPQVRTAHSIDNARKKTKKKEK